MDKEIDVCKGAFETGGKTSEDEIALLQLLQENSNSRNGRSSKWHWLGKPILNVKPHKLLFTTRTAATTLKRGGNFCI